MNINEVHQPTSLQTYTYHCLEQCIEIFIAFQNLIKLQVKRLHDIEEKPLFYPLYHVEESFNELVLLST
ncbi:CLUMA_CG008882, isoform A [Clunio marinus]|uniref:CLUMA_CG008882, isoform A n=1 Tax=Clunio marinus TaxID=568069 RepID=A0A1J1I4K8_9DIPT|nr:CLUMA_CG008882, isoform A [Clunio marinus]